MLQCEQEQNMDIGNDSPFERCCKEYLDVEISVSEAKATEIIKVLNEVLDESDTPLFALEEKDPTLYSFFIEHPFDESKLTSLLKQVIDDDPRVLGALQYKNAMRNKRNADPRGANQAYFLTRQLVIFELISGCGFLDEHDAQPKQSEEAEGVA